MKQKYNNNNYKQQKTIPVAMIFMAILLCFCLVYNYNNIKLGLRISNFDQYILSYKKIKYTEGIDKLKNINSSFLCWLDCPGVNISLPIVKTNNEQEENFYLDHDFEKYNNPLGSPYQKSNCNIEQTANTVFVGHSTYNQTWFGRETNQKVFGNLQNYLSSNINLDVTVQTLTKKYTYKIFASFSFDSVNHSNDDIIAYTTADITTQSQFNNFYNTIKDISVIQTDTTAQFGDRFLTLFTCSPLNLQNRVVVVAKLISVV